MNRGERGEQGREGQRTTAPPAPHSGDPLTDGKTEAPRANTGPRSSDARFPSCQTERMRS